jgi:hypothetical protein
MVHWAWLILALQIGAFLGICIAALLSVSRTPKEDYE